MTGTAAIVEKASLVAAAFRGGRPDADSLASALGISRLQLAAMAGIEPHFDENVTRSGHLFEWNRLREVIEILDRVEPWAGGLQQALAWFRGQGIAAFGDQTAEALVRSGRADALRSYLDGIAVGGYA